MDALLTAAASGWFARLGWALLHFLWQGAVVGLCYAVLLPLLRHASAQARYLVSLAALLLLGACVPVTLWFLADAATAGGPTALGSAVVIGTATGAPSSEVELGLAWLGQLAPWLVPAWAIGVALLSTRLSIEWYRVRTIVAQGTAVTDPLWAGVIERVSRGVGLRRAVQLLESVATEVPVVVGWLRPVVLVPSSVLVGLDPRQLELILLHELAHVRRGDYLVNLVQVVLETLLFYHPVVRWISNRVREERENCCDDLVVHTAGDRLAYARALLELDGLRGLAATAAMSSTGGNLAVRIRRIIGMPAPQQGAADWLTGVALTALGIASLGIGAIEDPSQRSMRPESDRPQVTSAAGLPAAASLAREPAAAEPPQPSVTPEAERQPAAANRQGQTGPSPGGIATMPAPAQTAAVATRAGQPAQLSDARGGGAGAVPTGESASEDAPSSARQRPAAPAPSAALAELEIDQPRLTAAVPRETSRSPSDTPAGPGSGPRIDAGQSGGPVPAPEPVVTGGRVLRMAAPEFPTRARSLGHEGYVVVEFTIGASGRPHDIEVVDVGPRDYFSKAAIRAIRQWRFEPVRVDGQAVEKRMTQRFSFVLDGSEPVADEECVLLTGSRLCR